MGLTGFLKNNTITKPLVWKIFYKKQAANQYKTNKQLCDRLLEMKNKHSGEICFIIGTGPSLTGEDLNRLKNTVTFGTHRIFTTFEQTDWRPTYYVAQDYALIKKIENEIKDIDAKYKFLPAYFANDFGVGAEYKYFVLREYADSAKKIHFSNAVNRYIAQGFTVTYASIQLAVYMGFKEIYLLGVDHNYSTFMNADGKVVTDSKVTDYFGGEKFVNDNLPRLDDSTRGYIKAKQYADSVGVKIYNATRGGKLEVFPRVDFDKLEL